MVNQTQILLDVALILFCCVFNLLVTSVAGVEMGHWILRQQGGDMPSAARFGSDSTVKIDVLPFPKIMSPSSHTGVDLLAWSQGQVHINGSVAKQTPKAVSNRWGKRRTTIVKPGSRLHVAVTTVVGLNQGMTVSQITCAKLLASKKARIANPNNIALEMTYKPTGEEEGTQAKWARLLKNSKYILSHYVGESSRAQYSVGWRCFEKFLTEMKIEDPFLIRESPHFVAEVEEAGGPPPFQYKTQVIISFVAWMYGDQNLMHSTVGNYISGVRYFFREGRYNIAVFDEPAVSQARTALQYLYVQRDCLVNEKKRLPMTCEMVCYGKDVHFSRYKSNWKTWAFVVGTVIAFLCLMRASELLITAERHYLRGQDVTFGVMVNGSEIRIYPSEAWSYSIHQLLNVCITIHSAKNDWEGEGHRLFFSRLGIADSDFGFEIVLMMFEWSQHARPLNDDAFLMYKQKDMISYDFFNAELRKIATKFGLDQARYSFHSLRIGGATTLAAAGKSDHCIKKMGRWKSLAFLEYIHWAISGMADAYKTLANPFVFTVEHLKRVNPAVAI